MYLTLMEWMSWITWPLSSTHNQSFQYQFLIHVCPFNFWSITPILAYEPNKVWLESEQLHEIIRRANQGNQADCQSRLKESPSEIIFKVNLLLLALPVDMSDFQALSLGSCHGISKLILVLHFQVLKIEWETEWKWMMRN